MGQDDKRDERGMKSFTECLDDWTQIIFATIVFAVYSVILFFFLAIIWYSKGAVIYYPLGIVLVIGLILLGPPYLCYLWNNRKFLRKN
jgi:hypothetical protein